ncbi:MAG: carbohydrate ABC transporter permease [Firmicutes bacterium]|nr:carbohydrate ABC transporter permease [Bacillota bacterium]
MSVALPRRQRRRGKLQKEPIGIYVFLTIIGIIMFLPMYQLIITAFKPLEELFLFPPLYYVKQPTLQNFEELLIAAGAGWVPFSRYVFNSVFVTLSVVSLHVFFACLAAYPLAKSRAPGVNVLFQLAVAALMFSAQITNIPRYLIVNGLGWINTYWALIIPGIGSAYGVFLMKQFLEQVPNALIEAAKIDGASEFTIFRKLILPLSRPAWSTLIIFSWISTWNDSWSPMVFTQSEAMKTMPLAIQTIFSGANVVARQGANAAAALIQTAPTVIIFLLLQKQVISTMAYSGIKS